MNKNKQMQLRKKWTSENNATQKRSSIEQLRSAAGATNYCAWDRLVAIAAAAINYIVTVTHLNPPGSDAVETTIDWPRQGSPLCSRVQKKGQRVVSGGSISGWYGGEVDLIKNLYFFLPPFSTDCRTYNVHPIGSVLYPLPLRMSVSASGGRNVANNWRN